MTTKKEKPFITEKELVSSLMVISEAAKNLAMEVILSPSAKEKEACEDGGEEDVDKASKP